MNQKTTVILVAALLVGVIGVWWAQSSRETPAPPKSDEPKALIDPPLGELASFEVKIGAEPAMTFEKKNDKWWMTAPVQGPSEHWNVDADARKINEIKCEKSYPRNHPDRPGDDLTSLDRPLKVVKLTDDAGKSVVVKLGKSQTLSRKTYVQKEGDDTIYLADRDLHGEMKKGLSDYRGKRVAEFVTADAVRVEVGGERQYTLARAEDKWTIESPIRARAERTKVDTLLAGVSNLMVQSFVDDAGGNLRIYGLEPPRLTVAVTTEKKTPRPPPPPPASAPAEPEFDVETRTVRVAFGAAAGDNVFAGLLDAEKPVVFQLAKSVLTQIGVPLDDLRDKRLIALDTNRAQKIALTRGGESIELTKPAGTWAIAGGTAAGESKQAEFAAVDDFLKALRDLKADGFEDDALRDHGFDAPQATIEITAEGQIEPALLTIGGRTPTQTGTYVRNEREGFVAVVNSDVLAPLLVEPLSFLSRDLLRYPIDRLSKIELARRDGEGDCTLVRQDGVWRFAAPIDGPAEAAAVAAVATDLSNLRGRRVVGRAANAAKFGLEKPAIRAVVTIDPPPTPPAPAATQPAATQPGEAATAPATPDAITTTQPESQPAVAAAETPPEPPAPQETHTVLVAKQGDVVYAMTAGSATICEVDGKVHDDLDAELFDTKVASIEPSQATRVRLGGASPFTFEKIGDKWVLQTEPTFQTDPAKITTLLEALRDLRARRFVKYKDADLKAYGLDAPQAIVAAETSGGASVELWLSSQGPGGGDRYATTAESKDRVFVIKADDAAKFAREIRDFQKAG